MKINFKALLISVAIPLLVGGLSALSTRGGMEQFAALNKPPLSPPGILFPIVWTILYILMGVASYLVLTSEKNSQDVKDALTVYGAQLILNFFWSKIFFNMEWYLFAFFWIVLLWVFIFQTIRLFYPISKTAAYLMIPYLLWVTFAGYLNLGIVLLN